MNRRLKKAYRQCPWSPKHHYYRRQWWERDQRRIATTGTIRRIVNEEVAVMKAYFNGTGMVFIQDQEDKK